MSSWRIKINKLQIQTKLMSDILVLSKPTIINHPVIGLFSIRVMLVIPKFFIPNGVSLLE